jgi:soluble epoxide hydrolase/lipid-phosphate phosphatase
MQAGVDGGLEGGKLAFVEIGSGHWVMLEFAEETNRILENFFENGVKGFGKSEIKASL